MGPVVTVNQDIIPKQQKPEVLVIGSIAQLGIVSSSSFSNRRQTFK